MEFKERLQSLTEENWLEILDKASERQRRTMMEQLQTEQEKIFTPTPEDIFSEQNKRRLFRTKDAMADYINTFNIVAAQFRKGFMQDGSVVYELIYNVEED